jgi:hypothetical protein
VQKVLGLAGATVHSLQVFTADPEHRVPTLLGAAHGTAKPTDEPGRRPQVGWVEPGRELDGTVERPQGHVAVLATVADRERHAPWCPPRARPAARAQHGADLLLADGTEGEDPALAEKLRDGDLAELAPVVPVRREDNVPAAAGEHADCGAQWPRRERRVVRLHHLARRLPGRHHQRGHLAVPEQHHAAVAPRQVPHRLVRELTHEVVQGADDRKLPRPRRQPQPVLLHLRRAPALVEDDEQQHKSQYDVHEVVVFHQCCARCSEALVWICYLQLDRG